MSNKLKSPKLTESDALRRMLDFRFCRVAYQELAGLSDEELLRVVRAGRLSPEQPYNPTEFIQQALSTRQLPDDFDPIGYQMHQPNLWGPDWANWEAALHYIKIGRSVGAKWKRPFDPIFYRDLYLDGRNDAGAEQVEEHRRVHPNRYSSLNEALVRCGWRSGEWTTTFNAQSYIVYNTLTDTLRTSAQALVHFIEYGWRDCLAISAELEFDPSFYADFAGPQAVGTQNEAYRSWIERGLGAGMPANESGFLRMLGIERSRFPDCFDWRVYLEDRPEITEKISTAGRAAGKWDAVEHLVTLGVLDSKTPLPISADALPRLLLEIGDRFARMQREDAAARCYDLALLHPVVPVQLLRHAGDQATRLGHYARALALYRQVRSTGAPGFWTWCNGALAALEVGEWAEASEWVLAGMAQHPRSARLEDILLRIQHAQFNRAITQHIRALRAGQSDAAFATALDGLLDLFLAAHRANFGSAAPSELKRRSGRLRVVVLANKDLAQCTFYRVDLKTCQLDAAGDVDLQIFERSENEAFRSAAATADVAIFYRLASSVELLRNIAACRSMNVPTIYEIDDLVFDAAAYPDLLESYAGTISADEHFGLRAGVALVHHAITICDAGLASTEQLATYLRQLVCTQQVIVARNGLSEPLATLARVLMPHRAATKNVPVTLFYGSGTRAHGADFRDLLEPALMQLMTERHDVRFIACGHVDAAALAAQFPGRVEQIEPILERDAYLSQMLSIDINIAVLKADTFNDCKSEIKWLEAAAFCVPSVVSDVKGYRETLADAIHVVRVHPDPKNWYAALQVLVCDPARRAAIGAAARDRALELYTPSKIGHQLADGLRQIVKLGADGTGPKQKRRAAATVPAAPRRQRLLLVNVFFPPQAIGGATRVISDQTAELLARYADRFDVGVLCGNDEEATPYSLTAYAWQGIPVWSVGCPRREHMDWIAFDPAMAKPVDAVLDRFQPDLVHAHCIQRLTATSLERVMARGIPYVITVHDAWWVSDHQFLVDAQDRLCMPWDGELFESVHNPHTQSDSWSRRLRLRIVLDTAAAVLVVSKTFASIYQRAGIAQAMAVPNGIPELPPLKPAPQIKGRVRIAHLGGVMAHKGYFLLRKTLERNRFDKLDLLVMDHAMTPGDERLEVWGTTSVLITGRVAQSEVGALYGKFDVLCAPSLWPESYGLVAREALHYGKWVIASKCGAIGEDVTPGRNGWVIDVSDPAALTSVFNEIHADWARYSSPPAKSFKSRTVAHQVDEVVRVYEDVLCSRQSV